MRYSPIPPSLVAAALLAATGPPGSVAAQAVAGSAPQVLVTGRVLERGGGDGIAGARVVLVGTGQERATDSRGMFEFLRVRPGRYWLHVERLGYGVADDTVVVPRTGRLDVEIRLAAEPLALEPVIATVEHPLSPGLRGFYERRRANVGRYLTRADFEEPGVTEVTRPLRRLPGIRLVPRVQGGGLTAGYRVRMRGDCAPAIYVDGVPLAPGGPTIDEIVSPQDVEGIEVYAGAETPLTLPGAGTACGAVAIWTRPGGGRGTLSFWRGVLYAGAFAAVAALLVLGL